jgi:quercetin dioxygenase-like cupin family protein
MAVMLVAVCLSSAQSTQVGSTSSAEPVPTPLLLEKNEGEQRVGVLSRARLTPKSNGSRHLMLMTEDIAPGDAIPMHKHLEQDEVVLIEKGTIHAHVGDQERDLHAGGIIFIPAKTWVTFKNIGSETASTVGIFSAPGFEDHLRCESVAVNEKATPISGAEEKQCDHMGHVVYKDLGEEAPKK